MPVFGAATESLSAAFQTADLSQSTPDAQPPDLSAAVVDAGRALMDVGCVQCHPLRGEYLPGVLGVDLAAINDRVRLEWFRNFILDPASLKPRTRMPTFFASGNSPKQELLDGDVDRQIDSLWVYLSEADKHPLPEKIEQAKRQNFELVPRDRPILLRTFMDDAGPHAIAVGFPEGVHFAFDAETVRVAQLWRGRFLDAHGTWYDRFTPPAHPLGTDIINLPAGSLLLKSDSSGAAAVVFGGYRLDKSGTPTFLYHCEGVAVQDRLVPAGDRGLRRELKLKPLHNQSKPVRIWLRMLVGSSLQRRAFNAYSNEQDLLVIVDSELPSEAKIQTTEGNSTWLLPFDLAEQTTIEVTYRW